MKTPFEIFGEQMDFITKSVKKTMKIEPQDFEGWLEDKFMEDYTGIKDDCGDAFERYLEQLDGEEWLGLGQEYGDRIYKITHSNG